MCEYFGYRVQKLVRVRIMNIELGDLEPGTYRNVTPEEYQKLMQLIARSSNQPVKERKQNQLRGTYTVVNRNPDREDRNGRDKKAH